MSVRTRTLQLVLVLCAITQTPVFADIQQLDPPQVSQDTEELLERIFASPDFGHSRQGRTIQFKPSDTPWEWPDFNVPALPNLQNIIGVLLRFILVATAIAAVGFALWYAWRHSAGFSGARRGKGKGRAAHDLPPAEPLLLLEQAEQLYHQGMVRQAWAVCYGAFLAAFTQFWQLSFPADATEYDALAIVRLGLQQDAPVDGAASTSVPVDGAADCVATDGEAFAVFVRRWTCFAYGGILPHQDDFLAAVHSCRLLLSNWTLRLNNPEGKQA